MTIHDNRTVRLILLARDEPHTLYYTTNTKDVGNSFDSLPTISLSDNTIDGLELPSNALIIHDGTTPNPTMTIVNGQQSLNPSPSNLSYWMPFTVGGTTRYVLATRPGDVVTIQWGAD